MDHFKVAEMVYLLCEVARDLGPTKVVPEHAIKDLSIFLLRIVEQIKNAGAVVNSTNVDALVNKLVMDLRDVYIHCGKKKNGRRLAEINSKINKWKKNGTLTQSGMKKKNGRLAETSSSRSITLTIDDTFTQLLLSLKIAVVLVEMIFSQQIKSLDSLYPLVNKAVQGLHVAFHGSSCVIGGEPINVEGVKDEFAVNPWGLLAHSDVNENSARLINIRGTTSYLTATIQCLHRIPELKSALIKWRPLFETSSDHLLTAATGDLFRQLRQYAESVAPTIFLQLFEEMHPTSLEMDNHNPKDAESCWMQLLDTLSRSLKSVDFPSENINSVNDLFNIKLVYRKHSRESGEKPPEEISVRMLKWPVSSTVDYLHDGLKDFLETGFGKAFSLCIGGLPRYLTIRFFRTEHRLNCKICLLEVDVYNLCSEELRAKLRATRKSCGEGSSNGSEDSSKASEEGLKSQQDIRLTGVYDLVACLTHDTRVTRAHIKCPGQYSVFVDPIKRVNRIDRPTIWYQYMDENYRWIKLSSVEKIIRGGSDGCCPYIGLYKARVANS